MKRLFLVCLIGRTAFAAYSQQNDSMQQTLVVKVPPSPVENSKPTAAVLTVQTDMWMYSQRMPAGMLYPFVGGGIGTDIIRKSSEQIGDARSHLQGQAGTKVNFDDWSRLLLPSKKIGWTYCYAYTSLYAAQFDQPAFDLVFRGNAPFAGKTLESRDLRFNTMSWNHLGAVATWRNQKKGIKFQAGAGWVFMRNYQNLRMPSGAVFTSAVGDSVFMGYDLDYTRKDRNPDGFYSLSHGFATSLAISGYKWREEWTAKAGRFLQWHIEVSDLGMVSLGKHASRYQAKQGVQVFGWDVPFTPYGIDSTASFRNYFDTLLKTLNPARSEASQWVMLPALFRAELSIGLGQKGIVDARLDYRMYPGFIPRARLEYSHYAKKSFGMHLNAAYGGVHSGDIGIGLSFRAWESLWITARAISVEGLLLPGVTGGAGGMLQARMRF